MSKVLPGFSILVAAIYSCSSSIGINWSLGSPINTENAGVATENHLTAHTFDKTAF